MGHFTEGRFSGIRLQRRIDRNVTGGGGASHSIHILAKATVQFGAFGQYLDIVGVIYGVFSSRIIVFGYIYICLFNDACCQNSLYYTPNQILVRFRSPITFMELQQFQELRFVV